MSKKNFFKTETITFLQLRSRDVICFFIIGVLINFATLFMLNFGDRTHFLLPILFINTAISFFVAFSFVDAADDFKAAMDDLDDEEKNSASGKRFNSVGSLQGIAWWYFCNITHLNYLFCINYLSSLILHPHLCNT